MRWIATVVFVVTMSSVLPAEIKPVSETTPARKALPPVLLKSLRSVLPNSARIFSGTVVQVRHHSSDSSSSSSLGTTAIWFRVDDAIRGVRKGRIVMVKEWAGLWQSGEQYHRGQRVLLFLYPSSKLGLTSPVPGFGRFAVNNSGVVVRGAGISFHRPIAIQTFVRAIRAAEKEQ